MLIMLDSNLNMRRLMGAEGNQARNIFTVSAKFKTTDKIWP